MTASVHDGTDMGRRSNKIVTRSLARCSAYRERRYDRDCTRTKHKDENRTSDGRAFRLGVVERASTLTGYVRVDHVVVEAVDAKVEIPSAQRHTFALHISSDRTGRGKTGKQRNESYGRERERQTKETYDESEYGDNAA